MNISIYNIKKWYKMVVGKSILHVNQDIGKIYSKKEIRGYYNDLTEKVLRVEEQNQIEIPKFVDEKGESIIFPIAVFQYGLGSYDLYLIHKKKKYLDIFKKMADWAMDRQEENGGWNNFYYIYPKNPYSAMAQGEGASLLIRAYKEFNENKYLLAAEKAINFMLASVEEGGTSEYYENKLFLKEFTHKPVVLNGWIFAIFGLYDYIKVKDDKQVRDKMNKTLDTLEKELHIFDNNYWSMYNSDGMLTSPFYHNLHIAQLAVLGEIFNREIFKQYANKFSTYKLSKIKRFKAFIIKALQKICEKKGL